VAEEPRRRDAARSRQAILDAAERLFAEAGYEAVTLQAVGAAAGVSRGTPGYFFGSKERLYRAVLDRASAELDGLAQRLAAAASGDGALDAALERTVSEYIDFVAARRLMVHLLERESVDGARLTGRAPHVAVVAAALEPLSGELSRSDGAAAEPHQLALSLATLCWGAVAQGPLAAQAAGLDAGDPAFLEARKRHVVALALGAVGGSGAAPAPAAEARAASGGGKSKKKRKKKG
jgi:TetR/AcrR family transcriptional regulator